METDPLLFGDVFLYRDEEYIFLGANDIAWYAAKIITVEQTKELNKSYLRALIRNRVLVDRMPLYCFVELQTKDFEGRAAHLGDTQKDKFLEIPRPVGIKLETRDQQAMRDIILKDRRVPFGLIEIIKSLNLEL